MNNEELNLHSSAEAESTSKPGLEQWEVASIKRIYGGELPAFADKLWLDRFYLQSKECLDRRKICYN